MAQPKVLILTPVKDALAHLDDYFGGLYSLDYPRELLSVGLLESDSKDGTLAQLQRRFPALSRDFRRTGLWKQDFAFQIPPGTPRWAAHIQRQRRIILAKSRNRLLFAALREEDWVLWLDVDVVQYPPDILQRLLATGRDILQPNCVKHFGGQSFDLNAWRDRGRYHLHDLRDEGELVRLHAVGATMLLVRADLHREGLIFPPYLYGKRNRLIRHSNLMVPWSDVRSRLRGEHRGEIESEGLGMMAHDMGYECWGMPRLEIRHKDS
jgi:hypothetical protein